MRDSNAAAGRANDIHPEEFKTSGRNSRRNRALRRSVTLLRRGENSARTSEIGDWVNVAKTPFVALIFAVACSAAGRLRASRLRATLTPVARAMHAGSDEGGCLHGRPNPRGR